MASFVYTDKKMGGESQYITKDGVYYVTVDNAFRDDVTYTGGVFAKYTVEMTVRGDVDQEEQYKMIKGEITKPQDKWATADDKAWGGWNAIAISKYAIGAGFDKDGTEIPNLKVLAEKLVGKHLKIEVKRQQAKDGNMYARVIDVFPYSDEVPAPADDLDSYEVEDDDIPF